MNICLPTFHRPRLSSRPDIKGLSTTLKIKVIK
jgi:hypothetical protein